MKRKLQIFISSTFKDLISERQACVEAVLRAGHIPAGMELFSAGSESQWEIIKRWIDDSDVYLLLLGGRYGSLDPKTELSYTEMEYQYAIESGKPFFALVMSDQLLDQKVKNIGKDVLELIEQQKFQTFKEKVLSKISRFFNDETEIKLAILESIIDIQNRFPITGWVRANEVPDTNTILTQVSELNERNRVLEQELRVVESGRINRIGDYTFEELKDILSKKIARIPRAMLSKEDAEVSVLDAFIVYQKILSVGVTNRSDASEEEMFLVIEVVSFLRIYDLAEIVKVANVAWSKFQTSKLGNKFLAMYSLRENT